MIVKKLSRLILCLMLISFFACSKTDNQKAQEYIASARAFINQNKLETAVIEYRNAIQAAPDDDLAYFEIAETFIMLRQLNQAVRYYNLAAQVNPQNISAYLRLAQIHMQTDNLLDARGYVSKVLDLNPLSVPAYHLLSSIQIKERDLESAIETLNKAVSIDNKNIKTYNSLAQLYIKTKSLDKAENAYISAITHDTTSRQAYMGLVRIYAYQNKLDEIEILLKGLLETEGIKSQKLIDLARFYEGQKKYDLAEKYFQIAVTESKNQTNSLIQLARFYLKRNLPQKSISSMKDAILTDAANPSTYIELSRIYLHFSMIEDADKEINKALQINPNLIDAIFQKGRVLMGKEEFKEALDKFDHVIALNGIHTQAYYYRALCIKKRGATERPEQKIFRAAAGLLNKPEEFEKDQIKGNLLAAITVDPGFVEARMKLTEMYILENNLKKAREQIEEVFRLSPPNLKTMTLLSGVTLIEGDIKEAEKILKVIIDQKPDYIPAQIRMGLFYKSIGRKDQAVDILLDVFDKYPVQLGVVEIITEIYTADKKYDTALGFIDKSQKKATETAAGFFETLKGEIYIKKKDTQKALHHFEKAKLASPDYIKPYMYIADFLFNQKQFSKALEEYRRVEKINPSFIPAVFAIGFIYDIHRNVTKAEEYYKKVLRLKPDHANAANNLAFILSEQPEHLEEAFRLAKIAREKSPKDPNVLDTMGWVYYQKGNYLTALTEIKDSLELNPQSALASFHYGMALYQTKKYEAARKYFRKALEIDPQFKDAKTARKILN